MPAHKNEDMFPSGISLKSSSYLTTSTKTHKFNANKMALFVPVCNTMSPFGRRLTLDPFEALITGGRRRRSPWEDMFIVPTKRHCARNPFADEDIFFSMLGDNNNHGSMTVKDGDDQAMVSLALPEDVNPKDVKVSLNKEKNLLMIKGTSESRDGTSRMSRSFEQVLSVPADGINVEGVKSSIDHDTGRLVVTLPKLALTHDGKKAIHDTKKPEENDLAPSNKTGEDEGFVEVQMEKNQVQGSNEEEEEVTVVEEHPTDDTKPFKLSLNLEGYDPNKLRVEVVNSEACINISGQKEVEDGAVKHFAKKIAVDKDLYDLETVTSSLGSNGLLAIRAERKKKKEGVISIPVNFVKSN